MTTYLYWHALSAAIAAWMLVRFVPMANLVGVIALVACAILGPFALFALVCGAFMSINAEQNEHSLHGGHDPEFYKHRHDRRHH